MHTYLSQQLLYILKQQHMRKNIQFLMISLLLTISQIMTAQFDSYKPVNQKPAKVLTNMSEDAAKTGKDMERMRNSIFDILDPAIKKVLSLSDLLNDKGGVLNKEEHDSILESVKNISHTFEDLSKNKEKWKYELESTIHDVLDVLKDSQKHMEKYQSETDVLSDRLKKKNADGLPEIRKEMMQMGINLSAQRAKLFSEFHQQLGEYKDFNENVRDDIGEFLNVIEESAITTGLMVELLEVSAQREVILKNLDGLLNLESYMKNINDSLQNLGRALMKLQKITDDGVS